jgi:hypothetical protein
MNRISNMVINEVRWIKSLSFATIVLLVILSFPAQAEESDKTSDWEYNATVYLWGANITTETPAGTSVIPFYKLLDNLEMAFMGTFEARRDDWAFGADAIYMNVQRDGGRSIAGPDGGTISTSNTVALKSWVVTPTARYTLHESEKGSFDLVGGFRYLDLNVSAKVFTENVDLLNRSTSGSNWDAIIGARARINLNKKWYIPLYADIGTGDSDSTWQAMAGIAYRFESMDLTVAYRHLDYDFKNHPILKGMTMKGPIAGLTFHF